MASQSAPPAERLPPQPSQSRRSHSIPHRPKGTRSPGGFPSKGGTDRLPVHQSCLWHGPMLDILPDVAPPQAVRLADYQPPAFLIDTVELHFELGETDTRVTSRLGIRRNPSAADRKAPLSLDGEALELVSLALDGEVLGANRYQL